MCNDFRQRLWEAYCKMMQDEALGIGPIDEVGEIPGDQVRPSDPAAIISASPTGGLMVEGMRWGWPPHHGKGLVINVRSESRKDPPQARGVSPFEVFYEFRGEKAPKSKFEFSPAINEPLAMAVIKRGDRFALATAEPGPDVADIHGRQPVILRASEWRRWLTDPDWPADLMQPSPAGTLQAVQVR